MVDPMTVLSKEILDKSDIGIYIIDAETYTLYYANDAAFRFNLVERKDFDGQTCHQLFFGNETPCSFCKLQRSEKGKNFLYIPKTDKTMLVSVQKTQWLGRKAYIEYVTDITDEIKSKELLNQERERYRLIAERNGIAFFDMNQVTGEVYCSENFKDYNLSKEGIRAILSNTGSASNVYPDDIPAMLKFFEESQDGRAYSSVTLRLKHIDGSFRFTIMSGYFVYNAEGTLVRSIGTFEDIHDQKLAEIEKQEQYDIEFSRKLSAEKGLIAQATFNVTQDHVLGHDPNGMPVPTIENKHSIQEIVNKITPTAIGEGAAQELAARFCRSALLDAYKNGREVSYAYRRPGNSGRIIWAKTTAKFMTNPSSHDLMAFINTYDITWQVFDKQIMKNIIRSNYERIALIDVTSKEVLQVRDQQGVDRIKGKKMLYDTALRQFCLNNIVEASPEEAIAHQSLEHILSELATQDTYYDIQSVKDPVTGNVLRKLWHFSFLDETKQVILQTQEDITSVYQKEQQSRKVLQSALKSAEEANLYKTDFLARMSHEIRTPINAIIGLAELSKQRIEKNKPEDTEGLEYIAHSISSANYLLTLVNDILDMSKIESGEISISSQCIAVRDFIESIQMLILPLAEKKGVHLTLLQKTTKHPYYYGDKTRLQQVLINLLNNALKFTPAGGQVTLVLENIGESEGIASLQCTVTDTGIGISEAFLEKIFDPFTQEYTGTTSKYGGTGLGLTISRRIARLMGGDITVKSTLGKGSCFTVTLKATFSEEADTIDQEGFIKETTADLSGLRILLCDDHPLNRMVASRLMQNKACLVECAENGQEAVEKFTTSPPGYYQLIFMDIRMPIMDGLHASRAIRSSEHQDALSIPIIAMTANAYVEDIQISKAAGMDYHLSKPIDAHELYRVIAYYGKRKR